MIRTRFAPSPNGSLHLGHAYAAVVAHDLARAAGNPAHRLPAGMVKDEPVRRIGRHQLLHHSPTVLANATYWVPHRAAGDRDGKRDF